VNNGEVSGKTTIRLTPAQAVVVLTLFATALFAWFDVRHQVTDLRLDVAQLHQTVTSLDDRLHAIERAVR